MSKQMNHAEYQRKCRKLTDEQLHYIIIDAAEAMEAWPDGENAGYYADEQHYAAMELKRRERRAAV